MHCITYDCAQNDHCCRRAVKLHSFIHSIMAPANGALPVIANVGKNARGKNVRGKIAIGKNARGKNVRGKIAIGKNVRVKVVKIP